MVLAVPIFKHFRVLPYHNISPYSVTRYSWVRPLGGAQWSMILEVGHSGQNYVILTLKFYNKVF